MKQPPFFQVGHRTELGSHIFTAEEIIRFASRYDPQIFHLDPEAAPDSLFKGHCASGWHTAAVWMRKQRDHSSEFVREWAAAGQGTIEYGPSPGFRNLKWLKPVYAGEEIVFSSTTSRCRPSASRPGWNLLATDNAGHSADGRPVITFETSVFIRLLP